MKKIETQPLYEQVLENIKDMIRNGTYVKGDQLPSEKELMDSMGVSRVTVRQSLRLLAEAGIIETKQGKGSVVKVDWQKYLNPGKLRDQAEEYWKEFELSTQARRIIEPAIAKQAALMATDKDIARLEEAHHNMLDHIEDISLVNEGQELQSFHSCLWDIIKNPLLKKTYEDIAPSSGCIRNLPSIPPASQAEQRMEIIKQHSNILDAIKNHDGDYAYFYMLEHCDWIYKTYKQYFDELYR